jgi:predicted nucleic acid-binding Zn ribbon protein
MSFVKFDYKCSACGDREERFVRRKDMDKQWCYNCGAVDNMTRMPAAPATTFKFADPSAFKRKQ